MHCDAWTFVGGVLLIGAVIGVCTAALMWLVLGEPGDDNERC